LRCLLNVAVALGGAGLVGAWFEGEVEGVYGLEDVESAEDLVLIGLHLLDDADQAGALGEVAVVESEVRRWPL
jgi:hypothetical protein